MGTSQQIASTSENTTDVLSNLTFEHPILPNTHYQKIVVKEAVLRTVNTSTEQIKFVAGAIRADLDNVPVYEIDFSSSPARVLDYIQINSKYGPFHEGGNNIKGAKWQFKYGYFLDQEEAVGSNSNTINRRLRLKNLQKISIKTFSNGNPTEKINPYKFFYVSNNFPHRLSKAIDHWGYYNGEHDNQANLVNVPPINLNQFNGAAIASYGSSNREPDADAMKQGTLDRIAFPTGAVTDYTFEPHEYATFEHTPIPGENLLSHDYDSNIPVNTAHSGDFFLSEEIMGELCEIATPRTDCSGPTKLSIYNVVEGDVVNHEFVKSISFTNYTESGNMEVVGFAGNPASGNPNDGEWITGSFLLSDLGLAPNHTYVFALEAGCSEATFNINKIAYYHVDFENHMAGGLRIQSIRQSESGEESENDIIKTYTYESVEAEGMSSGVSFGAPVYAYATKGNVNTIVKTVRGFSNIQFGLDAGLTLIPSLSVTGGVVNENNSITLGASISAIGSVGVSGSFNNIVIPISLESIPEGFSEDVVSFLGPVGAISEQIDDGVNNFVDKIPLGNLQTIMKNSREARGMVSIATANTLSYALNPDGSYQWPDFSESPNNYGFVAVGASMPLLSFQVGLMHGNFEGSADFVNINFVDQGLIPLNGYRGYHIGYKNVQEHFNGLGRSEYHYNIEQPIASRPIDYTQPVELPIPRVGTALSDGMLRFVNTYDAAGELVQETIIDAKVERMFLDSMNTNVFAFAPCNAIDPYTRERVYNTESGRYLPTRVTKVIDGVSTTTNYRYNNPLITSPTATWTINSNGDSLSTEIKYAHEMGNETLIAQNIIAQPLETKQYVNGVLQGGSLVEYDDFENAGYQAFRSSIIKEDNTTYWTSEIEAYDNFAQPQTVKFRGTDAPIELTWLSRGQLQKKEWQGWEQEWVYEKTAPLAGIGVQITNIPKAFIDFDGQETHYTYDALIRPETVTARDGAVEQKTSYPKDLSWAKGITNIAGLPSITSVAFLDGFGRQQFSGTKNYAPDQSHVVHGKRKFDKYGRVRKSYLPIDMGTSALKFGLNAEGYYGTTIYEDSPLSRPIKQIPPESDEAVNMKYGSNTLGDAVKIIRPSEATGAGVYTHIIGIYEAGSLYKRTFIDESGRSTDVFTDKIGRKILIRKGKDRNDTYYVYDDKGNLTDIHTPQSVLESTNEGLTGFKTGLDFHFEYDDLSRVTSKKIPGSGPTTYVYHPDNPSLLEQTTDANGNVFHYVYDQYERLVQIRLGDTEISSTTYYELEESCAGGGKCGGRIKSTTVAIFDGMDINGSLTTIYNQYDEYGRPLQVFVENHLDGTDVYNYTYDMADRINKVYRIHNGTESYIIDQAFDYDHMGRLNWHKVNGVKIEENTYNYRDELLQVEHHVPTAENVSNPFVSQGYKYDVRGRLTSLFTLNKGQDLFPFGQGQPLHEACIDNDGIYPGEVNPGGAIFAMDFKYEANGNIAQTRWQALGKEIEFYEYEYDQLNRLKKADYGWWSDIGGQSQRLQNGLYNMEVGEYDANGNIKELTRWSGPEECNLFECPKPMLIDDLGYNYNHLGQLTAVKDGGTELGFDSGTNSPGEYTYDNNGNMVSDPYKDYTIQYNALDLPAHIPELGISWKYDASGRKLAEYSETVQRDYVDGILYKDGTIEAVQHAHGRITADGFYEYTLSDHLGNGRVYLRDKNQNGILEVPYDPYADPEAYTEAIQEEHYYPFGMPMQGNSILSTPDDIKSRFGYNGNEALEETGFSDFNARLYRADLGRFMNVDPLATDPSQVSISPYAFAWNDPVGLSDPSGLFPNGGDGGTVLPIVDGLAQAPQLSAINVTASGSGGLSSMGLGSIPNTPNISGMIAQVGILDWWNNNDKDMAILVAYPDDSPTIPSNQTFARWFEEVVGDGDSRMNQAGHAGIVIIDGETGYTSYFDFGRYNRSGLGRKRGVNEGTVRSSKNYSSLRVPNWNSNLTDEQNVTRIIRSLHNSPLLRKYGKTVGALATELDGDAMLKYARTIENRGYVPFGGYTSSCATGNATYCAKFARGVGGAGGIDWWFNTFKGIGNINDVSSIYRTKIITVK